MTTNVLILCTGNSCRSILAEALLNKKGEGRLQAFSAGSKPSGEVNPHALALLQSNGYDTSDFLSKSWDEFSGIDAQKLDVVITVCGNAAGETCPVFLGAPVRGHWGVADPADATGSESEIRAVFTETYRLLELRVDALLHARFEDFSQSTFAAELARIGNMEGAA